MNIKYLRFFLIIIFISSFVITCNENPFNVQKKSNPLLNKAPETYLFLFPAQDTTIVQTITVTDTTLDTVITEIIDTTASKQILHWWGDDSDGEIIGYYIQWDYESEPRWTTSEYDTFYVPIRTLYDEFTFKVWAVDNDSLMDSSPAVKTFPVFNSYPEIEFKNRSNPPAPAANPEVIAYTFPTRTFMWDVTDPDGIETVTKIYYALDDTTSWTELPGNERSVTLTNIQPGEHKFFVMAEDIAGAKSQIITFPDSLDDLVPNHWVVNEPIGDVLLVNDYAQDQNTLQVQSVYESMLQNIVGIDGYSVWQIGTQVSPQINPQNSLPYATADVKANLKYFKKIVWFSHLGRPSLSEAGLSLTQYISEGGKVFISNGNEVFPDTLWTFTNIDSVFRLNPGGRLLPGIDILASFTNTPEDSLLDLEIKQLVGNRVSALIPGPDVDVIYRMEPDSTATVAVPYSGSPAVGLRYEVGLGKSIYFSLPFHYLDGYSNLQAVLQYILEVEFE